MTPMGLIYEKIKHKNLVKQTLKAENQHISMNEFSGLILCTFVVYRPPKKGRPDILYIVLAYTYEMDQQTMKMKPKLPQPTKGVLKE